MSATRSISGGYENVEKGFIIIIASYYNIRHLIKCLKYPQVIEKEKYIKFESSFLGT